MTFTDDDGITDTHLSILNYTMELAAPGIKKEYCRVSINDDGNLCIAIEKGEGGVSK